MFSRADNLFIVHVNMPPCMPPRPKGWKNMLYHPFESPFMLPAAASGVAATNTATTTTTAAAAAAAKTTAMVGTTITTAPTAEGIMMAPSLAAAKYRTWIAVWRFGAIWLVDTMDCTPSLEILSVLIGR